jgi:hypothetical protein
MKVMNRRQEKLLSQLVAVSGGDSLLVEKALRATAFGPTRSARLRDVVEFIKKNRQGRRGAEKRKRVAEAAR